MGRRIGASGALWGIEEELCELKKLVRKYFRAQDCAGKFNCYTDYREKLDKIEKDLKKKCRKDHNKEERNEYKG